MKKGGMQTKRSITCYCQLQRLTSGMPLLGSLIIRISRVYLVADTKKIGINDSSGLIATIDLVFLAQFFKKVQYHFYFFRNIYDYPLN